MKILHVYKDFDPPVRGGMERHMALMCRFQRQWAEVEALTCSRCGQTRVVERDGTRVTEVAEWGRLQSALLPPDRIGGEAVRRARFQLGAKPVGTGLYTAIVENQAAGRLSSMLKDPLQGGAIQQRRSFLEGKLGAAIASDVLTITDDPFVAQGLGSGFFDGEGMSTEKRPSSTAISSSTSNRVASKKSSTSGLTSRVSRLSPLSLSTLGCWRAPAIAASCSAGV